MIVGAGIGGLAAAIALRRGGWEVGVVEQAASPRELGFALALAPNALRALGELGLRAAIVSQGVEVRTFEIRRIDGRVLKRVDLHGDAVQSVVVLRQTLHGTLLDTVGEGALQLGRRVNGVADSGVGSRSSIQSLAFDDRDSIPLPAAEVIVGADGVGSVIRRALHPGEAPPRPSGYHALRGVTHDAGDALGGADAAVYLGDGVEIGCARASASAVYWYVSLVDEFVGADIVATLERCMHGLDPRVGAIAHAARREDIRLDRLLCRAPLNRWGRGRVTLLGDAAHPVLPHTAQGAALALEDALALGLVLARARDVEVGLRSYEQVRAARTQTVVNAGPRIAAMTTTRSRVKGALRAALVRLIPARALSLTLTRHARDPHRALRG